MTGITKHSSAETQARNIVADVMGLKVEQLAEVAHQALDRHTIEDVRSRLQKLLSREITQGEFERSLALEANTVGRAVEYIERKVSDHQKQNIDVRNEVLQMLEDMLGFDVKDVMEQELTRDLGMESLDYLELIFRLEKHFNIKIPREEFNVQFDVHPMSEGPSMLGMYYDRQAGGIRARSVWRLVEVVERLLAERNE